MSDNKSFSDEMLNAYIDGELEADERAQVLQALRQDENLSRRVCQLQKVHNMVQLAYQDVELPEGYNVTTTKKSNRTAYSVAASIFLVIGAFFSGWVMQSSNQAQTLIELAQEVRNNQTVSVNDPWRLVLHLSTDDTYRINIALSEIEHLLAENRQDMQKVSVEILANGKGMKLLRSDTSPYAERIKSLQSQYENILFLACGQSIARMKKEKGIDVKLLDNTQVVPSAIHQVIRRQREGWTYVHI